MAQFKNVVIQENCEISNDIIMMGKSMSDILYPINSTFISSENINPSDKLGGTWELVSKSFRSLYGYSKTSGTYFTRNTTNVSEFECCFIRTGNTLRIRLAVKSKKSFADTELELGTLDFNSLGITGIPYKITQSVSGSDGGDAVMIFTVDNTTGLVSSTDIIGKTSGTLVSDAFIYIECFFNLTSEYMIDSFCDKFYWKRIA